MDFSPKKLNSFLFLKLPSAWWCGVRVKEIDPFKAETTVKHQWFNQNPFQSIYFAVLAMCAELATGVLVMYHIKKSGKKVAMLVTSNTSNFTKKARGKITFSCNEGTLVAEAIHKAIETNTPQKFWLNTTGIDEKKDAVATFSFEWSVKAKNC